MKGIVIYHSEFGVYLGSCMGMGFWSKLDPVGQDCAATFPSREEAQASVATWDKPVKNCQFVEVEANVEGGYASIEACKKAGLPGWDPSI